MSKTVEREITTENETTTTRTVQGHVWERSRRGVALPVTVGIVGLAALGIGQGWPNRHSIEKDLTDRSSSALAAGGAPSVTVSFAGRDGTVSGTVETDADRDAVLRTVRQQTGVRVAIDRLTVKTPGTGGGTGTPTQTPTTPPATSTPPAPTTTPAPTTSESSAPATSTAPTSGGSGTATQSPTTPAALTPADVKLSLQGGKITLTGALPEAATRKALVDAATALVGAGKVTDSTTIDAGVDPAGLDGLPAVLAAITKDGNVDVTLSGGTIALDGTVPSDDARQAALTAAETVVGGDAAKVRDGLTVSPGQTGDHSSAVRNAIAELPKITFTTGSATLTPAGRTTVRNVAEILAAYPDVTVEIQGHTDSRGTRRVNQELSAARARTVLLTLRHLGIDRDRLTSKGFGETKPAVPNDTAVHRAQNRRVVFKVL